MDRNWKNYERRAPRRVCFRPRDDVYDHPPLDLASNDEEFIRVGEIVLKKMSGLRRQSRDSSWFRRVLRSDLSSSALQNDENEDFLDTEMLKRFKRALLARLDDEEENNWAPRLKNSSRISSLISAVLRHVNEVGWPKPDEPYHAENFIRNDMTYARSRSLKSSDWCLYKEYLNDVSYDNKNLAHSTVPPDLFTPKKLVKKNRVPKSPRGLSGLLTSSEIAYMKRRPEDAKEHLRDFDSPEKVTEEITRLRKLAQERGIDEDTRKYCDERIGYLNMILEGYGYYNAAG